MISMAGDEEPCPVLVATLSRVGDHERSPTSRADAHSKFVSDSFHSVLAQASACRRLDDQLGANLLRPTDRRERPRHCDRAKRCHRIQKSANDHPPPNSNRDLDSRELRSSAHLLNSILSS